MNRSKKLVILLVVLALVIVAFIGVTKLSDTQDSLPGNNEVTTVAEIDTEKITSLSWTFGGNTYTIEKVDGIWVDPSDAEFEVNQNLADYMASVIAKVEASQTIFGVDDYKQYGLDETAQRVIAGAEDGTGYELVIGSQNEVNGDYYAMITGAPEVYVIDVKYPYNFGCTMNEMKALSDEEVEELAEGLSETMS